MTAIKIPKKLIEVALPLDDINVASAHEKSVKQGHPASLHLYWARRPLATARAVIFAQMVNDPGFENGNGFQRGLKKSEAEIKREELFQIIRDLVKWENTNNEKVLNRAREAIKESWRETCQLNRNHPQAEELFNPDKLPAFHDPFAGGGAIPLEAQRLGLESYASDLNPVALMINKTMLEYPARFYGIQPVCPQAKSKKQNRLKLEYSGLSGMLEDIGYYGNAVKDIAISKIGNHYPELITKDSKYVPVISWIWVRTVKSPNPAAAGTHVPLIKSPILSNKKGKFYWVEWEVSKDNKSYEFYVKNGSELPENITGTVNRKGATCILTNSPITLSYIREQGKANKIGYRLMAIAGEGKKGRIYSSPLTSHLEAAKIDINFDYPKCHIDHWAGSTNCVVYGYKNFEDLFTKRQLLALTTFSDSIIEIQKTIEKDALSKGMLSDGIPLCDGGQGARAYSEAISSYLALALDKMADLGNSFVRWEPIAQCPRQLFGKQAIPMVWDFAEANPFSNSSGSWSTLVSGIIKGIERLATARRKQNIGRVLQGDAAESSTYRADSLISTDPPYYDNVPYSNLSDFFYIWMRRTLKHIEPKLFSTLSVPKLPELVANQFRHGGKDNAEKFFLQGMKKSISEMVKSSHPAFPVTIYYAFKQSETKEGSTSSAGWETFLDAVIEAGFSIDGTWPMRTENSSRMMGQGNNALASSIVLVCQKRPNNATTTSRRDFQRELRTQMPEALETMIGGETGHTPIAPVDLAQAAIGPGIAIFSKYEAVLNQDGSKMSVHDALIMINKEITEFLDPNSGSFDGDTLFCSSWFDQHGWSAGVFGEADTLARAKGTSVDGIRDAGIIESGGGKVRILKWAEYPSEWDPIQDARTPIWEACHHMIRKLNQQGESEAGALLARMPEKGEPIRQLAYHLYTLCERKKWAEDARAYNELIGSWNAIVTASHEVGHAGSQLQMNFG